MCLCIPFPAGCALTKTGDCIHELIIHRVENMKWVESEGTLKPFGYKTTQFITM